MAADEGQEKTEEPTSKKLNDAAKKGQVARSRDLGTAFVVIFSAIALLIYGGSLGEAIAMIMRRALSLNRQETYDETMMFSIWTEIATEIAGPIALIFFVILVAAFVGNSLLGGFNWSVEAMLPKASKMDPGKGIVRIFGPKAGC